MEIEALDDMDTSLPCTFEPESSTWNGREVRLMDAPWAETRRLVDFFLGSMQKPREIPVKSGDFDFNFPISLSQLLNLDALNQHLQIPLELPQFDLQSLLAQPNPAFSVTLPPPIPLPPAVTIPQVPPAVLPPLPVPTVVTPPVLAPLTIPFSFSPLPFFQTLPIPQPPATPIAPVNFYPQSNLENVFGKDYVSELYRQFKLPDPFSDPNSSQPPRITHNLLILNALKDVGNGLMATQVFPPELVTAIAKDASPAETALLLSGLETIGKGILGQEILSFGDDPEPLHINFADKSAARDAFVRFVENKLTTAKGDALKIAEPSCFLDSEGRADPHLGIGMINGMCNKQDKVIENRDYLNGFIPGMSIDCVWNKTHGIVFDMAEILFLNYAGGSPHTSDLLMAKWTEFHLNNLNDPDVKYLQFCHSQGTIHVYNTLQAAPQEIRNRIIVVGIAPAAVVTDDMCFRSFYYASKKDFVYLGELLRADIQGSERSDYERAMMKIEIVQKLKSKITFLDPHPDATGIDHDFVSPTFAQAIQQRIDEYFSQNGVYK